MFWTQIRYDEAIHLTTIDLWLDPRRRREWAFISHAHSDHIATHRSALLSAATARFVQHRRAAPREMTVLPFGAPQAVRGVLCTLYPAGHILGSAQLLLEVEGARVLYSGDFKLQGNSAAEAIEIPRADVLIMETTFGHRQYVFPPRDEVIAAMAAWCGAALAAGITPVLLGYALGKGQEILAALAGRGFTFLLHDAVYQVTQIAEELGAVFPPYARFTPGAALEGAVVICPPHLRRSQVALLPRSRSAIVSGWALDPAARYRFGTDAAFCLSDHADYRDLLTYVERVAPRRVYTVHGHASEFANELRRRGCDATALDQDDQLALF